MMQEMERRKDLILKDAETDPDAGHRASGRASSQHQQFWTVTARICAGSNCPDEFRETARRRSAWRWLNCANLSTIFSRDCRRSIFPLPPRCTWKWTIKTELRTWYMKA